MSDSIERWVDKRLFDAMQAAIQAFTKYMNQNGIAEEFFDLELHGRLHDREMILKNSSEEVNHDPR